MPEKFQIKFSMPNDDLKKKSAKKLSFKQAVRLIESKDYSEDSKKELIARLKQQPANTYEAFLTNIHMHLKKIQDKKNLIRTQLENERVEEDESGKSDFEEENS